MNLTMLMWQCLAIAVSMLCLWQRPKIALAVTAVVLVAIVLAPASAFAATSGAVGALGAGFHLPAGMSLGLALLGVVTAPALAPALAPAPGSLQPDVSSVDAEPAEAPPIWASQSFWLAVLAFLAPIVSAKLGVQINTPELATELAIVLGFVGKHAWTMHTTNATQVKVAEARADVLKAHVTAAALANPAAAAAALAKS